MPWKRSRKQTTRITEGKRPNVRFARQDGQERYVVWGAGQFIIPQGISGWVSVVPDGQGSYAWQPVAPGQSIRLSEIPLLLR